MKEVMMEQMEFFGEKLSCTYRFSLVQDHKQRHVNIILECVFL